MNTYAKTASAALFLLLPVAIASQAQPLKREQIATRMAAQVDSLVSQLQLSTEQEEPVRAVLMEQSMLRMQLRQRASGGASMRERMLAVNDSTVAKLTELLSDEQLTRYQDFRAQRRPARRGF